MHRGGANNPIICASISSFLLHTDVNLGGIPPISPPPIGTRRIAPASFFRRNANLSGFNCVKMKLEIIIGKGSRHEYCRWRVRWNENRHGETRKHPQSHGHTRLQKHTHTLVLSVANVETHSFFPSKRGHGCQMFYTNMIIMHY